MKGKQSFSGGKSCQKKRFLYSGLQKGSLLGFGVVASVPWRLSCNRSGWIKKDCRILRRAAYWNCFFCYCAVYCSYGDNRLKNKNLRPLEVFRKTVLSEGINPPCFRMKYYLVTAQEGLGRSGAGVEGSPPHCGHQLWLCYIICFELMKTHVGFRTAVVTVYR